MTQVFRPSANGIARLVLWALGLGLLALVAASVIYVRSGWATGAERAPRQPIPFSHAHHVGNLGIDCRYCHTGVEVSASAGLPPTETCMTCHSQLYTNADLLAPVRESFATGQPIPWVRVHDLADFVYFNHSIHVAKGVACQTCHGEVNEMPLIRQVSPLTMGWCLNCHRNPEPHLRPPQEVFNQNWRPPADLARLQAWLVQSEDIHPENLTDCYVCHR